MAQCHLKSYPAYLGIKRDLDPSGLVHLTLPLFLFCIFVLSVALSPEPRHFWFLNWILVLSPAGFNPRTRSSTLIRARFGSSVQQGSTPSRLEWSSWPLAATLASLQGTCRIPKRRLRSSVQGEWSGKYTPGVNLPAWKQR